MPLLSSPGAIDSVMTHAPELGSPDAGAGVEPYNTLVRVAGQLEGFDSPRSAIQVHLNRSTTSR